MQEHEEKERGQSQTEDEEVICSNELLAAIRARMAKRRSKEKQELDNQGTAESGNE